jgi:hypothetical protein
MCDLSGCPCCKDQHFLKPKSSVEKFLKIILKNLTDALIIIFSFAEDIKAFFCIVFIFNLFLTFVKSIPGLLITFSIIFDAYSLMQN